MADPNPFRESAYPTHAMASASPSATNTAGIVGLVLALAGIMTCGLLFPIGLIVSLFGLRKAPRGLAIAGTVVGLSGTVVCGVLVAAWVAAVSQRIEAVEGTRESAVTEMSLLQAQAMIERERVTNGSLPDGIEGNKVILEVSDVWENSLRYERHDEQYTIRSAGKDGQFNTDDDRVVSSGNESLGSEMLETEATLIEVEE